MLIDKDFIQATTSDITNYRKNIVKNMVSENRIGKIRVSDEFIRSDPDVVQLMMGHIVIVEAESKFAEQRMEYTCYSNEFDQVEQGVIPPTYDCILSKQNDLPPTLRFEKNLSHLEWESKFEAKGW